MFEQISTRSPALALHRDPQMLLQETNHRVANALQITASMVRLEAGAIADRAAHRILMSVQSRIEAIAMVHRLLYQSGSADSMRLDIYLHELIDELASWCTTDSIGCRIEGTIAPVAVSPERASILGILVTELVTNARKHAFPGARSGRISVRLDLCDGHLILQISDDGIGQAAAGCFKAPGVGHRLIEAMVAQLRGTFHDVPVPCGTTALIRFSRHEARA